MKPLPFKFLLCGKLRKDVFLPSKQNVVPDFRPVSFWEVLEKNGHVQTRALAEGGGVSPGQDAPGELPREQIWIPQCWIQGRNHVFPENSQRPTSGSTFRPLSNIPRWGHIWGTSGALCHSCTPKASQHRPGECHIHFSHGQPDQTSPS